MRDFLNKLMHKYKSAQNKAQDKKEKKQPLSKLLEKNLEYFKKSFDESADLTIKPIKILNTNAAIIVSISKIGKENDDGINSNIRYLLSDLENPQKAAKVWLLEYNKDDGKVACPQIALFKSDKLTDILDEDATKGVLLIYKKAKNIADSINVNDAQIYYEMSKAKSKISLNVEENRPVFNVSLCADLELYNADDLAANSVIKPIIENRLVELMQKAIDSCIKKNGCDIFNFYRYIMNANASFFKENLANLEEVLKSADYEISVQAKIRYMGANQKISSLVY